MNFVNTTTTTQLPLPITLPKEPAVYRLLLEEKIQYNEAIDHLTEIVFSHREEKDWLSLRLFTWGTRIISVAPHSADIEFPSDFLELAQQSIDQLFQRVFINPITGISVHLHPEIVTLEGFEEEIWAQVDLDDILSVDSHCPCHGAQMTTRRVHPFATNMLAWIKDLPFQRKTTPQEEQKIDPFAKYLCYQSAAGKIKATQILKQGAEQADQLLKEHRELEKIRNWEIKAREVERAYFQDRMQRQEREFSERLSQMHQVHKQEMDEMQAHQTALEEKIEKAAGEIFEIKNHVALQESEIRKLRNDLANAEREIAEMQARMKGDNDDWGCIVS